MSTRQLLNLALGAVALLLCASLTLVWNQGHGGRITGQQIELAKKQQIVIQDLGRQVAALQKAEDQEAVVAARRSVGQTVLEFDRNLAALAKGAVLTADDGHEISIARIRGGKARRALEDALQTWRDTGTPLANLAAGEYSIYSAAGQDAVHGLADNTVLLMQQMGTIANSLRTGALARQAIARLAGWGAGIFGVMLVVLVWLRIRVNKLENPGNRRQEAQASPATPPREQALHLAGSLTQSGAESNTTRRSLTPDRVGTAPPAETRTDSRGSVFTPPVDFVTVNATVDRMTVDMSTIANSTDKMRLAIDSVGHALQGMLYSLNEMAQDTTEGYKIVRGANNAASFTAQAAEDLVASAREMSRVVSRVTELALKTRQVAAQIDAEAVVTGQPGEAFTSVVAAEVKGLARQTSQATLEIENTVSEILATSRRYEEAIGQIIKNISAINKVSEHLGELMLSPAPHAVPGMPPAPLTPAGDADQAPPAPEEPMAAPTASDEPEPSVPEPPVDVPDPFAREPEPDPEGDPEGDPEPKPAFSLDDDGEAPVPSLEEVAQETQDVIQELGLDIPGPAQEEAPTPPETEAVASEAVPDKPSTPGDDPAAEEPADVAPADGEPAAETPSESTAPKPVGSNGNVFLLNKPRNPRPLKSDPEPEAPAGTTEDLPASDGPGPEPEPETVPADKPSPTVMRLNKTKD